MRKILRMPFLLSLVAGITIACGGSSGSSGGNETGNETGSNEVYSVLNNIAQFDYQNGLTSADAVSEEYLLAEYKDWFNNYVVDGGNGSLRVRRDASSDYDTVSEGMAYGMLLAVYFNDRVTFDKLYAYVLKHSVPEDDNGNPVYLMHWKVNKYGVNISEFRIPVPHDKPYMKLSDFNKPEEQREYTDKPANTTDYVQAATWDRQLGSATDADLDIAIALIFASNKWNNSEYPGLTSKPKYNYREYAAKTVRDILYYDITDKKGLARTRGTSEAYVSNGSIREWGKKSCWNPSYFTPAWFRIFKSFIINNKKSEINQYFTTQDETVNPDFFIQTCDSVLTTMYAEMKKIDTQTNHSGLYPDWCDTSAVDGTVKKSSGSDRMYYLDNGFGGIKDVNADGIIDTKDGENFLSYNFYYDAVRVPWRLATDYAWFGNKDAKDLITYTAEFFNGRHQKDPNTDYKTETDKKSYCLYDGYSIEGNGWNYDDRDGFNNFRGYDSNGKLIVRNDGGQNYSSAFTAMCATASLALNSDPANAKNWIDAVIATKDPQYFLQTDENGNSIKIVNKYTYYGNTLRLLSLLFMSGKFINPEAKVAIKGVQNNMYMTPADGFFYTDAVKGSATVGDAQIMGLISLGGDKIALRSSTGEIIRMYAEDPDYYNMLVSAADPYSEGIVIDNYDINPNAIFTMFDLIQGEAGSADYEKHIGFLNEAVKSHVYSSSISGSTGGITPMMVKKINAGITDNNGLIRPQLKFDVEVIKR